ncbi:MAG: hypothetical protein ACYTF1_09845 [Planctomycetota bacterium]|jgi:hypothetical protein
MYSVSSREGLIYFFSFWFTSLGLMQGGYAEPWRATVEVLVNQRQVRVWPEFMGINLNPGAGPKAIANPKNIAAVKKIGIKSVRFPNGCVADLYNWKAIDGKKYISVEQFLDFCGAIEAEPYYTLNLQGGTDNKEGPPPEGAELAEVIKYRHTAPNPCGYTKYHYGTLAEAVEFVEKYTVNRALEGKRPILCYEMGNENWGQAPTDWPPEVYGATIGEYARVIREVVKDARAKYKQLEGMKAYIIAVGYPLVGNNQDPKQATNHEINVRWTREINMLYKNGLIDAVQDHFYPYSNLGYDYLVWSHFNLQNIFYARRGVSNPLLGGYRNKDIAFEMPIEITEWNVKCWGEMKKTIPGLKNLEFEEGTNGWQIEPLFDSNKPDIRALDEVGRHKSGVRIAMDQQDDGTARLFQCFDWKPTNSNRVFASAWVRTDKPEKITLSIKTVNQEGEPGNALAETGKRRGWRAGHWHKIMAGGKVPKGAKRLAICIELAGPDAEADVDGVQLFYWNNEPGENPAAVDTPAQQLFLVDGLRLMIEHGIRRSHLHHLFGGYPCGIMLPNGRTKGSYKVFELFAGCLGTHTVKSVVKCDSFNYVSRAGKWATAFNALAPNVENVPLLSALAMRDERNLYLLMINRSTDQPIKTSVKLNGGQLVGRVSVRSLLCEDFDIPGLTLLQKKIAYSNPLVHELAPHSAYMFKLKVVGND